MLFKFPDRRNSRISHRDRFGLIVGGPLFGGSLVGDIIDSGGKIFPVSATIIDSNGDYIDLDPYLIDSDGTEHRVF